MTNQKFLKLKEFPNNLAKFISRQKIFIQSEMIPEFLFFLPLRGFCQVKKQKKNKLEEKHYSRYGR